MNSSLASDFLQRQVAAACQHAAVPEYREWVLSSLSAGYRDAATPRLESPLEGAFFAWWHALLWRSDYVGQMLTLVPQKPVSVSGFNYRIDFVVEPSELFARVIAGHGWKWPPVAIELDGHAFHEKTREQVAARNQRDRLLQAAGWTVFHLSYDEIDRRGAPAVGDVIDAVAHQLVESTLGIGRCGRA